MGQLLWQRQANTARGQFAQVLYGNGIQTRMAYDSKTGLLQTHQAGAAPANSAANPATAGTDASIVSQSYDYNALGHLTQRGDANHFTQEQFLYDNLNRLSSQILTHTGTAHTVRNVSYSYNAIGNILSNSEVGQYTYATAAVGSRPHALASINGQAGKLTNPHYSYDAHGNIASVTSGAAGAGGNGASRTHSWTSFDNPLSMSVSHPAVTNPANVLGTPVASIPAGSASIAWLYGPEHQRIRETFSKTQGGQTTARTLYVLHPDNEGSLYFEREAKTAGAGAGTNENRHYLSAEKGSFLLITSSNPIQSQAQSDATINSPATITNAEQKYWHKDHLGSIVASTNSNLTVIERLAYDPFGKRRFTNGVYDLVGTIDAQTTNRGFTGHEHLDELDFIHMNARVYDPDIGRFLSPDPTIAHSDNPQSFNRYSYAYNNPLNIVDPSGFTGAEMQGVTDAVTPAVVDGGKQPDAQNKDAEGKATSATDPKAGKQSPTNGLVGAITVIADVVKGFVGQLASNFTSTIGPDMENPAQKVGAYMAMAGLKGNKSNPATASAARMAEAEKKAAQLAANKAKGKEAEQLAKPVIEAQGKQVIGSQVTIQTSTGKRVADHVTKDSKGNIGLSEVKSGDATRSAAQMAKDTEIATQGGKMVGKNAPEGLVNTNVKAVTEVVRMP
ncbi:MAG: hypothetical protein HC765_16030 [Brachymonas sp.]|nr:hypothetical protein [Brachymonas sp.]